MGRRAWSLRTVATRRNSTEQVAKVATAAAGRPDGTPASRPGPTWVIPQIRWLHEVDRLFPYGQPAPNPRSPAPVMEYALFNRPAGGSELLGHRAKALRHHPLSMEVDRNRALAWRVILGDDEHEGVQRDILTVTIGIDPDERLRHVAQTMGAGWMESVLSWPHRFVLPFDAGTSEPAELAFAEQ